MEARRQAKQEQARALKARHQMQHGEGEGDGEGEGEGEVGGVAALPSATHSAASSSNGIAPSSGLALDGSASPGSAPPLTAAAAWGGPTSTTADTT